MCGIKTVQGLFNLKIITIMKKLFILSVIGVFSLSSFSTIEKKEVVKAKYWTAMCADGTIGGYFYCDCTQAQANQIAHIMCN